MELFDKCLVCGKPIKEIGEMEQGMCIDCDEATENFCRGLIKQ
jgi:NMD protein affecting ribosome stability and mRNA decay